MYSNGPYLVRKQAVQEAASRKPRKFEALLDERGLPMKTSELYGRNAFTLKRMKELLPEETFRNYRQVIETRGRFDTNTANVIAECVKMWCVQNGVTHYTHWFQPLTGSTAEKHDSFLDFDGDGTAVERLTGKQLMQGEPDASSFPSGGIRETHEARGYTAWQASSPMFVIESENGKTLCIPTVFISHHGDALDEKTGLLRSTEILSQKATELLRLVGEETERVSVNLGAEQEYFLIDRAYVRLRPDLVLSGRTLIGDAPAKAQQLSDHYFAAPPERVLAFMMEMERECYKLGIPVKTRHNEVAPSQYETAPIYEDIELACDHNQILMQVVKKVARRHEFEALFHEKPFSGLNGTGKHCNWSIATHGKNARNLLNPGHTPHENISFLLCLLAVLKGIHKHNGLLRAAIASAGGDHRLGANEAPPAIMSVYLGDMLDKLLNTLETGGKLSGPLGERTLELGLDRIAAIYQEHTDRNRTSPFAFTGNKFEFRAVGGEAQIAFPLSVLNTIVAEGFSELSARLREALGKGGDRDAAIFGVVQEAIRESKAIRFEGNNYSAEWLEEAKKRGLRNVLKTPEALKELVSDRSLKMFQALKIFSESEVRCRYSVQLEKYVNKVSIEVVSLSGIVDAYVIPAACRAQEALASSVDVARRVNVATPQLETLEKLTRVLGQLLEKRREFVDDIKKLQTIEDPAVKAEFLAVAVSERMEAIRKLCNKLEAIVPDELWPLPKYNEMLYLQ